MTARTNLLDTAALLATVEDARDMITRALGLATEEISGAAGVYLPEHREWMVASTAARAVAIGDWLRGEAFAIVERSGRLTTVADPLHTVGTRD